MFKARVKNSIVGKRVNTLWSSIFGTVENNYQILAVAKLEKFYSKWMVVTRNYEEYQSNTYRKKRLLQQLVLLCLEVILMIRGLLLMAKSDLIPREYLGDFLLVLNKGALVFHILIVAFAGLTGYLRALIIYQEKHKVLDWLWLLHPFAVRLTSLRDQDMTEDGYRKFRIRAIMISKLMKLAHRLSVVSVGLVFILFAGATTYFNFSWSNLVSNLLWYALTMIWLTFGLASCFTILCGAYMLTLAFEIRYQNVTEQIKAMAIDLSRLSVTKVYALIRQHNKITKTLFFINKGARYFTSIIFLAIPFIDILMYMAFVTKADIGLLSKYVLVFVAFEAVVFVSYVLFRVGLISASAHRPYKLLYGLMKSPNLTLASKLKLDELIASLCGEPLAIDIMAIIPITYFHFYMLMAEAAGNFFLIAEMLQTNIGI